MGIDNVDFIVPFICASEKTRLRQLHLQQALMNRSYDAVYFHFLLLVCHTIHFILHYFCPLATAAGGGEGGPGIGLPTRISNFDPRFLTISPGRRINSMLNLMPNFLRNFANL